MVGCVDIINIVKGNLKMFFIVIKPDSTNGVLGSFSENLNNSLIKNGMESVLLDCSISFDIINLSNIVTANSEKKCIIISFNGALGELYIEKDKNKYFDTLNCLNIAWMVDDVSYHYNRLKNSSNKKIIICTSEYHFETLDSMDLNAIKILGLAGTTSDNLNSNSFHKRDFDIIIPATWMGEPLRFWDNINDNLTKKIILETIKILKNSDELNYFKVFKYSCIKNNINPKFDDNFFNLINLMQNYFRSFDRKKVISEFLNSDFKIGLIGSGWEKIFSSHKNFTIFDNISHSNIKDYYSNAKFVINFNSENGASERLFDALSVGCGVITSGNDILNNYFNYNNGVVFYDRLATGSAFDNFMIANNDINFYKNVETGSQYVLNNHTWDYRARSLIKFLKFNLLEF